MAYAEFYNLNANIAYPFVPTSTDTFRFVSGGTLPLALIVDCGFTIGPKLSYNPEVGAVYLYKLKRNGNNLEFTFRVTPNDGTEREFFFVRNKDSLFGNTEYVEATGGPEYGIGFLVTGDIRSLYDTLLAWEEKFLVASSDGVTVSYEATVEPALVVSLKNHAVLSVTVGNMLRITEQPCGDCSARTAVDNTTVKTQYAATNMVGKIRFKAGFNTAISTNKTDNSISVVAVKGEGRGEVCDNDMIRYVGDVPDQGARCRDYVFTINGIPPNDTGAFQLEGAGNFFVQPGTVGELVVNSKIGQTTVCADG